MNGCAWVWAGYGDAIILEDVSFAGRPATRLGPAGAATAWSKTTLAGDPDGRHAPAAWPHPFGDRELSATLLPNRRARAGSGHRCRRAAAASARSRWRNLTVVARPGQWNLAGCARIVSRQELPGAIHGLPALRRQTADADRGPLARSAQPGAAGLAEPLEGLAPIIDRRRLLHVIDPWCAPATSSRDHLVEQHARRPAHRAPGAGAQRGRVFAGPSDALLRDDAALDAWLGAGAHQHRTPTRGNAVKFPPGYVSGDPRIQPAQGSGIDRPTDLPDRVDVLIVGAGRQAYSPPPSWRSFRTSTPTSSSAASRYLEVGRADGIQPAAWNLPGPSAADRIVAGAA